MNFVFMFLIVAKSHAIVCPAGQIDVAGVCRFNWSQHQCGKQSDGKGFTDSAVFDAANLSKTFVNPKLVCCLNGWGDVDPNNPGNQKFDCVQSTLPALGPNAFEQFYNATGEDPVADAGLKFPNKLFLVDSASRPIVGFYKEDGDRCLFAGKKPSEQLALYDTVTIPEGVDQDCRFLVRAALEVRCPTNSLTDSTKFRTAGIAGAPSSPVVRCVAAGELLIHLDIRDLLDPVTNTHAILKYRGNSTLEGQRLPGDKAVGLRLEAQNIPMVELINKKFGACPGGFKNENGICVFD